MIISDSHMHPSIIWNSLFAPSRISIPPCVDYVQHESRIIPILPQQKHSVVVPAANLDDLEDGSASSFGQSVSVEPGQDRDAV